MPSLPSRYDVAIVGAGPAGAWAAFRLARAGARVALLDPSHPREKPCGGGVTGRALALVDEAIAGRRLDCVAVAHARFQCGEGTAASVPLAVRPRRADSSLFVIDRRSFDGSLLAAAVAAGAVHLPDRVRDVIRDGDRFTVTTAREDLVADRIVGADGPTSLVRRRMFRPFSRNELSIATGWFVHGTTADDIAIEFLAEPSGYIWSFPRADHLAIGVCAQADQTTVRALQEIAERWTRAKASGGGKERLERYSWPIPSLDVASLERQRFAGDGWLLAGDAAGLVDPITREGIFFALRSGEIAAAAIARGGDAAHEHHTRVRDEIVPELTRAARLKRGFFRGPFIRLLIDALDHSASVRDIMADLVAGRQPYTGLKRRLIATFEVSLAWRLLLLELQRGAS